MKTPDIRRARRGYTLVEMGVAMSIGLMVAVMVLALVNQQVAFARIFTAQTFLTSEAPVINNYLARVCGRADGFRIYTSVSNALSGTGAVTSGGTVVELQFRQADGVLRKCLLSYETRNGSKGLYYYIVPATGAMGDPNFLITKKPTDVSFALQNGLLRATLTGPAGERIVYTATTQL
jgi:hypothetical protein